MQKPILAIDIDHVLAHGTEHFIEFSNRRWGTQLRADDYQENWAKMWDVDLDELKKRAQEIHASGMFGEFHVFKGAKEALAELSKKFDIVTVTSRPTNLETETRAWLSENFGDIIKGTYFAGIYDGSFHEGMFVKTKFDILGAVKPSVFIDDQTKHCYASRDLGIDTILFGDYSWNRTAKEELGIVRCKDWQEALTYLDGKY